MKIADNNLPPYAGMKVDNNNNTISLPQSTWVPESNFASDILNSTYWDFTASGTTDELSPKGLSAGDYLVNYYLSVSVPLGSDANKTFNTLCAIYNYGSQLSDLTTERTLEKKQTAGNNPDVAAIAGTAIITIENPTDALYLQLQNVDQATTMDPIVRYSNINLFRIKTKDDGALPVTLSDFSASYAKNSPVLNWTTQSETDNLGFNLYRSENANGYEENDFIQINSTLINGMGTTSTPTSYSFVDEHPTIEGHTYWYWLQSVSTSQELELFGPVSLAIPFAGQLPTMTILNSNYPNPFNPETTIAFSIKENESGYLEIYNLKGQKILREEFEAGDHQYRWNAEGLSSGIYLYKLSSPTTNITKKMILMK